MCMCTQPEMFICKPWANSPNSTSSFTMTATEAPLLKLSVRILSECPKFLVTSPDSLGNLVAYSSVCKVNLKQQGYKVSIHLNQLLSLV